MMEEVTSEVVEIPVDSAAVTEESVPPKKSGNPSTNKNCRITFGAGRFVSR